jgi:hypothetical protein
MAIFIPNPLSLFNIQVEKYLIKKKIIMLFCHSIYVIFLASFIVPISNTISNGTLGLDLIPLSNLGTVMSVLSCLENILSFIFDFKNDFKEGYLSERGLSYVLRHSQQE